MAVATDTSMSAKHILPYSTGVRVAYSSYHQSNLSFKAKRKLEAYQLYQTGKLTMQEIATVLSVHKSTVSRWIENANEAMQSGCYQVLEPKSTAPYNTPREKVLTMENKQQILEIREKFKCGKDKIEIYLKRDYNITISSSTIGRYLKKLSLRDDPMFYNRHKVKRKRKRRKKPLIRPKEIFDKLEHQAFEHFQVDTKYYIINSRTFYIINAVDLVTRMMFSYAYTRHTATCARDFLYRLNEVFEIKDSNVYLQRDNGSEFMAEFEEVAEAYNITLVTNYVRQPKMNGYVERHNRTLKDENLIFHMPTTVQEVNEQLYEYLVMYNFERVHNGINNITPMEKYCEMKFNDDIINLRSQKSDLLHMLWTCTPY